MGSVTIPSTMMNPNMPIPNDKSNIAPIFRLMNLSNMVNMPTNVKQAGVHLDGASSNVAPMFRLINLEEDVKEPSSPRGGKVFEQKNMWLLI